MAIGSPFPRWLQLVHSACLLTGGRPVESAVERAAAVGDVGSLRLPLQRKAPCYSGGLALSALRLFTSFRQQELSLLRCVEWCLGVVARVPAEGGMHDLSQQRVIRID